MGDHVECSFWVFGLRGGCCFVFFLFFGGFLGLDLVNMVEILGRQFAGRVVREVGSRKAEEAS